MYRLLSAALLTLLVLGPVRADDKDATAVLDKAIQALGGAEKLGEVKAASWKSKGTLTLNGSDSPFSTSTTVQGLDHRRSTFEADFGGMKVKGTTVLSGGKGWRKFGDMGGELDADALANEKRSQYLLVAPMLVVPLKGKGFKVESAGKEKVGDKPAVVLKVTGPDGKDFKVWFDAASGLPLKLVATVKGFMNDEYVQETTYSDFKDFKGIKKATKVESKRDGETFVLEEVTEFTPHAKAPEAKTFGEPE